MWCTAWCNGHYFEVSSFHVFDSTHRAPHCQERYEDIADEAAPVRYATIRVFAVIANSMKTHGRQAAVESTFAGTGRLSSMERPVASAVAYLLACKSLGDSPSEVMECFKSLAKACDLIDEQELVAAHATKLVETICEVRNCVYRWLSCNTKTRPNTCRLRPKRMMLYIASNCTASSNPLNLSPPIPSSTRADREGLSDRPCVEPYVRLAAHSRSSPFDVPQSTTDMPGSSAASSLPE